MTTKKGSTKVCGLSLADGRTISKIKQLGSMKCNLADICRALCQVALDSPGFPEIYNTSRDIKLLYKTTVAIDETLIQSIKDAGFKNISKFIRLAVENYLSIDNTIHEAVHEPVKETPVKHEKKLGITAEQLFQKVLHTIKFGKAYRIEGIGLPFKVNGKLLQPNEYVFQDLQEEERFFNLIKKERLELFSNWKYSYLYRPIFKRSVELSFTDSYVKQKSIAGEYEYARRIS